MILTTLEVLFPLYRPVILARRLIECHADPGTESWDLGNGANIGYCSPASVGFREEADTGANCEAWNSPLVDCLISPDNEAKRLNQQ